MTEFGFCIHDVSYQDACAECITCEPWDETCARCGGLFSINDMVAEEGDEWECFGCNERCNDKDLIAEMALRAITKHLSKG